MAARITSLLLRSAPCSPSLRRRLSNASISSSARQRLSRSKLDIHKTYHIYDNINIVTGDETEPDFNGRAWTAVHGMDEHEQRQVGTCPEQT